MPTLQFNLEDRSPFNRYFRIANGALLPELTCQILDGTSGVDLTTATLTFKMDDESGTVKVNGAAGALVTAASGIFKYSWTGTDTDTNGFFLGQFTITISGKTYKVPNNVDQKLVIQIGAAV